MTALREFATVALLALSVIAITTGMAGVFS